MNRAWLGIGVVVALAVALVLVLTSGGDEPAPETTPAPTAAPTTSPPPTTLAATTTSPATTTTTAVPATTLDPATREAEVEALVRELELALWSADYRQDEKALADLIGGQSLWERWTSIEDPLSFYAEAPAESVFGLQLVRLLRDEPDCLVAEVSEDPTGFLSSDSEIESLVIVLWPANQSMLGWRIAERWGAGTPESEWGRTCDVEDRSWRP